MKSIKLLSTAALLSASVTCQTFPLPDVKVSVLRDKDVVEGFTRGFRQITRWPTDAECKRYAATKAEIGPAVADSLAWGRRVLNDAYLPADYGSLLFGLHNWLNGDEDVLFATYQIGNTGLRITDTSTAYIVNVQSDEVPSEVMDWKQFLEDNIGKYLRAPDKILGTPHVAVRLIPDTGIADVQIAIIPPPHVKPDDWVHELWSGDNPRVLVSKGVICIVVQKLTGGGNFHGPDYGVRQRFPPLRGALLEWKTADLVNFIAQTRSEPHLREVGVALAVLVPRPDADRQVDRMIALYTSNSDVHFRIAMIQAIEAIAARCGGDVAKRVRAFVDEQLAPGKALDPKLRSLVERARETLSGPLPER